MKKRSILTILVAALLLSSASSVVFAGQDNSLIGTLLREDVFHPDINTNSNTEYNEWHYFNLVDEEQNLAIVTTFKMNHSIAQVMLGYDIGANLPNPTENLVLDGCPLVFADFSDETPDVRIVNSTVNLTREGYKVHVDGVTMNPTYPKQVVFDALFKPCTEPHLPPLYVNLSDTIDMKWLVASPKMRVDGTLTVGADVYTFKNAKGYHDHNWGSWDWSAVGWDWGQIIQTSNGKNNDVGTYTISFGNVTDSMHSSSMRSVLNVWKNKQIVEEFNDDEMEVTHYFDPSKSFYPAPYSTTINASDQENIEIVFTPEYFIPLPVGNPILPDLIIWEGFGTYGVEGTIDGKHVCYEARGFMEYAASPYGA